MKTVMRRDLDRVARWGRSKRGGTSTTGGGGSLAIQFPITADDVVAAIPETEVAVDDDECVDLCSTETRKASSTKTIWWWKKKSWEPSLEDLGQSDSAA